MSVDTRLFERLARRDAGAMPEVYARFSGPVFSFALRTLGDREEAEEVLQDTFVRVWEKAGSFDPALGRPITWIFVIARGFCLDRLRRAGRRTRTIVGSSGDRFEGTGTAGHELPAVFSKDEVRAVRQALDLLPAADRRAVEMAIFLEYTGTEIANDTREPLGTVKSRIRRGLARMRQLLNRHDRT